MLVPCRICSSLFLASWIIVSQSHSSFADEPALAQAPKVGSGGCLAIAEPIPATGGWTGVYRAADDFKLTKDTKIREVVWWGCSYDGRHGEDDGLDQIRGFAIAIYENDPKTNSPGSWLHRTIVPLSETYPKATEHRNFGGSDVMRFKAALDEPFVAKAGEKYWLSVGAYISGEPMWVWFESTKGNDQNALDYGVNGIWGDQPQGWQPQDLAFELRTKLTERESIPERMAEKDGERKTGDATIKQLIAQLGDKQYSNRVEAEKKLISIGSSAVPFLKPHAKHGNPEVRYRIRRLLTECGELAKDVPMKLHTMKADEEVRDLAKLYQVSSKAIIKVNTLGITPPVEGMMVLIPE